MSIRALAPQDVAQALKDREIVLVDVREPPEYAAERIEGALLFPLSTFDPGQIPAGRPVIFHCASGIRSKRAALIYEKTGYGKAAHMAGGIQAWRKAGLATLFFDPFTGSMLPRERMLRAAVP